MKKSLEYQNLFYFLDLPQTKKLFKILENYDIDARFVGGCVRDALLWRRTDDLDIAVNYDIESLSKIFIDEQIRMVPLGIKYGSITVILDQTKFELTTLRRDVNCSGRACDIEPTTSFEEDAKRRDFTINALYVSKNGELFDYFEGVEDLKKGNVIFIGNPADRIKEDYLRILRYYRFAAKLKDYSDRYRETIRHEAENILSLSIERIQKELLLILKEKENLEIFRMIRDNGVFKNLNIEEYKKLPRTASFEHKALVLFGYETLMKIFHLPRNFKRRIENI